MANNEYAKLEGLEGPVVVTRDGEDVSKILTDGAAAFAWLLHHQGQSVGYALRYGGYDVRPATAEEL